MNEATNQLLAPPMTNGEALQKTRPISFLAKLASSYASGHLKVSGSSTVNWLVYLENGRLTYASHSVDPFERLDLHLRHLSLKAPQVNAELRTQVRRLFSGSEFERATLPPDYQAICWLVSQKHISPAEATQLVDGLLKEVMESLILLREGNCEFKETVSESSALCHIDLRPLAEFCQARLKRWQALGPHIWSPYQRPYLFSQSNAQQKLAPELQQKLGNILKGFSFRQLGVLLHQDEIKVAQSLRPYILNGTVLLREPKPPFDQLPRIPNARPAPSMPPRQPQEQASPETATTEKPLPRIASVESSSPVEVGKMMPTEVAPSLPPLSPVDPPSLTKQTYVIACIDDSPTILNEMKRFLSDETFCVHAINDPLRALIQVIRIKPDLILLDIGMPSIDGYKLCRLLRNHALFSNTPIVMVTGNTGIIDRAKAKFAGASDYLTKPFTKSELLEIVFRYLQ